LHLAIKNSLLFYITLLIAVLPTKATKTIALEQLRILLMQALSVKKTATKPIISIMLRILPALSRAI